MKSIKSYRIFCLAVLVTLSVSCEDFFTQYPSNSITIDNNYQSEVDFNQGVIGCYNKLKSKVGFHVNELAYRTDECIMDVMATSNQNRYEFDHFEENSSNGLMSDIWSNWYNGIFRCNDLLAHMEGKSFSKLPQYKGEALFIRSWLYFCLYRCFGVVPVTTTVVSPEEGRMIPRCTEEEMLTRLETDLLLAAELLPLERGIEKARVTKIAAQALLGKVYLTFGKYVEAEEILEYAMADPNYGLMPTTTDAFKIENKMNKEIIFALYYNKTNDNGHDFWWSSTSDARDRSNPTAEFRALYSSADNRLPLIRDYIYSDPKYIMTKWWDTYDSVFIEQVSNDFPHLRYADVILMYGEALAQQNRIEEALEYMNITRTRAGLEPLTTARIPDRKAYIIELANERGREFALEGQRWFDLVRLGIALEFFQGMGYKITEKNMVFPIPNAEIEIVNNPKILWQNPGY